MLEEVCTVYAVRDKLLDEIYEVASCFDGFLRFLAQLISLVQRPQDVNERLSRLILVVPICAAAARDASRSRGLLVEIPLCERDESSSFLLLRIFCLFVAQTRNGIAQIRKGAEEARSEAAMRDFSIWDAEAG